MTELLGKSCLVTGATSGIGKEIALGLAKMGATVILVGRKKERCEAALREITAKVNGDRVSYLVADLSSQAAIRQLAKEYKGAHQRLDVLVNNAGIFLARRVETIDGMESTLAVNHLAPFLLTCLLIDVIKASNPSRIITTSSVAHRGARIDFEDIQFERRPYGGIKAYGQSKLANILFTIELARKLKGSGVTANCFHPGAVRTNLLEGNPWHYRMVWNAAGSFFLTPEKGADTAIYLASSPTVEGVSGGYFVKRKQAEMSDQACDSEAAANLWKLSEKLVGLEEGSIV